MNVLNYQEIGAGAPLILIHGLFGGLENLNMVAKPLSESYRVISIDVRNHGNSFHAEEMNYELMTQDVINLMEALSLDSAYFLGHSMGGKLAMQVALSYPEKVKKLVVADIAPTRYEPSHLKIIEGLKSIDLETTQKRSDADKQLAKYVVEMSTRQFLLKNLAFSDGQAQWRCHLDGIANNYSNLLDNVASDAPYSGPTLFIKGGNSDYIGPEHRDVINQLFSDAKAKIIQGTGHWLHAEKPAAFNKIVADFLAS